MAEPTLADLEKAIAERDEIERRWADYDGNNPRKYESERRSARSNVRLIEELLKARGLLEKTDKEKLDDELNRMFPNAKNMEIVEHNSQKYRKRFFPAEKSRSRKTVTRWGAWWEPVS